MAMRYLRKKAPGRDGKPQIFPRTDILARRPDMLECDKEGVLLDSVDQANELDEVRQELEHLRSLPEMMEAEAAAGALDAAKEEVAQLTGEVAQLRESLETAQARGMTKLDQLGVFLVNAEEVTRETLDVWVEENLGGAPIDSRFGVERAVEVAKEMARAA